MMLLLLSLSLLLLLALWLLLLVVCCSLSAVSFELFFVWLCSSLSFFPSAFWVVLWWVFVVTSRSVASLLGCSVGKTECGQKVHHRELRNISVIASKKACWKTSHLWGIALLAYKPIWAQEHSKCSLRSNSELFTWRYVTSVFPRANRWTQ